MPSSPPNLPALVLGLFCRDERGRERPLTSATQGRRSVQDRDPGRFRPRFLLTFPESGRKRAATPTCLPFRAIPFPNVPLLKEVHLVCNNSSRVGTSRAGSDHFIVLRSVRGSSPGARHCTPRFNGEQGLRPCPHYPDRQRTEFSGNQMGFWCPLLEHPRPHGGRKPSLKPKRAVCATVRSGLVQACVNFLDPFTSFNSNVQKTFTDGCLPSGLGRARCWGYNGEQDVSLSWGAHSPVQAVGG